MVSFDIHHTSLKAGSHEKSYKTTLRTSGGEKPYSWSLVSGILPAGFTLDSASGAIAGIPTESGTFDLTFRVTEPLGARYLKM